MSNMNFFRPPYEQAAPQVKPYSFIDDLMGGIGEMSGKAAQAQAQREDMMMKIAQARDSASPEMWSFLQDHFRNRFPELVSMGHAINFMNQPAGPGAPAPQASQVPPQVTPQQIQSGGAALMGQPLPQPAPMQPAEDQAPAVPPVPVPTALIRSAGGQVATPANPFGALQAEVPALAQANRDLINRSANNQGLALATKAGAALVGKKDTPSPFLSSTPMAGRQWALEQEAAQAKADALVNKMDIGQMLALIKLATEDTKNNQVSGGLVNNERKTLDAETKTANAENVARAGASIREGGKARDQRVEAIKAQLDADKAELARLQTADAKDVGIVFGPAKIDRAKRKENILILKGKIQAHGQNLNSVTGNVPPTPGS